MGGTFFFTVVTYRRRLLFDQEVARHILRNAIGRVRETHPFIIDAWVLLSAHMHCMWTLPRGDDNFSVRWNLIKSLFSKEAKALYHASEWMNQSK